MDNKIFNRIIKNNGIIVKVNNNNEKLTTKEQFIDDLLQKENIDNILDCLQSLEDCKDYQTEWSITKMYCEAIKGLNTAIFLEMTASTLTEARTTNSENIKQLEEQKTRYIADFANYLYK